MTKVTNALAQELKNQPQNWAILLETRAENALDFGLEAIKFLTDKNYKILVLSATRPYPNLINLYKKKRIDVKKISVLDCISKTDNTKLEENKR